MRSSADGSRCVLLLDCDGVLADFHTSMLPVIERVTGNKHTLEELNTSWEIFDSLPYDKETVAHCYDQARLAGFCAMLGVYPGARAGIAALKEFGVELYIVTTPMESRFWVIEREQWLKRHFDIPREQVLQVHAKELVQGHVFVDDKAANVRAWQRENPDGVALLWNTQYNGREGKDLIRINNWVTLFRIVTSGTQEVRRSIARDLG